MVRFALVAIVVALNSNTAIATPQFPDTLVFGGRKYTIQEIPMLGLWDYGKGSVGTGKQKPPAFEARSSANWAGYRAQFEIRDSKLFLRRIVGWIDGQKRRDDQIIPGKRFPIVATWYTGKIHLAVGGFDDKSQESIAVMIFEVERGIVKSVNFAERMKPVWTWNGLPPTGTRDDAGKSGHAPEPANGPDSSREPSPPAR